MSAATGVAARPAPLLKELGFLADTPLVRFADRVFGEYADYGLALAIALTLPFLRGALDQFLFKVRPNAGLGCCMCHRVLMC